MSSGDVERMAKEGKTRKEEANGRVEKAGGRVARRVDGEANGHMNGVVTSAVDEAEELRHGTV